MDSFHIGKGRHHHLDFQRLENGDIVFEIIFGHLNIRLGKKAENLGEQITVILRNLRAAPILNILA